MFYIRERRLWIWIADRRDGPGSEAVMAMSTQRKTLDFEQEYAALAAKLAQSA
jgi:cytochrome c biogenesis protein